MKVTLDLNQLPEQGEISEAEFERLQRLGATRLIALGFAAGFWYSNRRLRDGALLPVQAGRPSAIGVSSRAPHSVHEPS